MCTPPSSMPVAHSAEHEEGATPALERSKLLSWANAASAKRKADQTGVSELFGSTERIEKAPPEPYNRLTWNPIQSLLCTPNSHPIVLTLTIEP